MTSIERTGEAFELEDQLTIVGAKLKAGDHAPSFALEHFDPNTQEMRTVELSETVGSVRLLNVINSLDTPVCHIETRQWEKLRGDLPAGVVVYTISMDLPFAQARWQQAESVEHRALSAHRSDVFGTDYGVLIKEWRLLQRAVFVIDAAGTIAYTDYVADQMREPNYDAAVAAVRATVSAGS